MHALSLACMPKVNSDAAGKLKGAWTPLVNARAVGQRVAQKLACEKFVVVFDYAAVAAKHNSDGFFESFSTCRDAICLIQGLRCLARPLKGDETRAAAVKKALSIISELEGSVPANVNLLLAAAAPQTSG